MIADRLRALVASWPSDNGDPPDTDYQSGYMAACAEHAHEVEQILAEDAGGWRPVQISSGWSDGAGLMEPSTWIVVLCADGSIWRRFDCDMIWTRIPSPPPQEPQP